MEKCAFIESSAESGIVAMAWAHRIDVANHPFSVGRVALYTWARDRQARLFDIVEARSLTMQR